MTVGAPALLAPLAPPEGTSISRPGRRTVPSARRWILAVLVAFGRNGMTESGNDPKGER